MSKINWHHWPETFVKPLIGGYRRKYLSEGTYRRGKDNKLIQLVGDTSPWILDKMARDQRGGLKPLEDIIGMRAYSLDRGELDNLYAKPQFGPVVEFANGVLEKPRRIYPEDLLEIINTSMRKKAYGPGVYIDAHRDFINRVRVGGTHILETRKDSVEWFRQVALICLDKNAAFTLEDELHKKLKSIRGIREWNSTYTWEKISVNAVERVKQLIQCDSGNLHETFRMVSWDEDFDAKKIRMEMIMDGD